MKHTKRNVQEYAVSPVVGVMLMLVVTIIIAAVVSAFSGGLAAGKEKAPQASLDCHITWGDAMYTGTSGPQFTMKHLGGDPINTKDVKLVTSWANATGEYHIQSTTAPKYNGTGTELYYDKSDGTTATAHYVLSSLNTHYIATPKTLAVDGYDSPGGEIYYNAPYLMVAGDMPADNAGEETSLWFGNYVLRPGDSIKADNDNTVAGTGDAQNRATPIIKDGNLLTANDIVNVKLIDLKSGSTIYSKDILVEM
ncbi:MAG: type IV pilin N-terminal domain-containing protein [Methanoregula sp.]